MSKAEILAELPRLTPDERDEIQAKLDELAGERWRDDADLTPQDKSILDQSLAGYAKNPNAGSAWDEVRAGIE